MKTLITANSTFEADSIIALLDSYNIKSYSTSRGAGSYFNIVFNMSTLGEDIHVNDVDFEKAQNIIKEYQNSISNEMDLQPEIKKIKSKRKVFSMIILFIIIGYLIFSFLQSIFF